VNAASGWQSLLEGFLMEGVEDVSLEIVATKSSTASRDTKERDLKKSF
jgi:hypothetical protein